MTGWLGRIVIAAVFAVVAYLICILLGMVLAVGGAPILNTIGNFLRQFAAVIALLVFLYYLFLGYGQVTPWFAGRRRPPPP